MAQWQVGRSPWSAAGPLAGLGGTRASAPTSGGEIRNGHINMILALYAHNLAKFDRESVLGLSPGRLGGTRASAPQVEVK